MHVTRTPPPAVQPTGAPRVSLGKPGLESVHVGDVGLLTASDRSILDYAAVNALVITVRRD
jgi:predicted nuclease of predicted toxin-antitoxin system